MQPEELFKEPENSKNVSPLASLETDLILYSDSIKEIAEDIIAELSPYPIFVAHQHEVSLGEAIITKDEDASEWNIHASTLDEFKEAGIVKEDKVEFFQKSYKDPKKFMCVFVIVPEGANFVFYPYK
jgi:hypothetical protein